MCLRGNVHALLYFHLSIHDFSSITSGVDFESIPDFIVGIGVEVETGYDSYATGS
jgi:hypothetical protein